MKSRGAYTGVRHRVITGGRCVEQVLAERGIAGGSSGIVPPIAVPPRWTDMRKEDPWQCLQDVRAEARAELGFSDEDIVVGCVVALREL